jgi:Common central domain of tyrosinase
MLPEEKLVRDYFGPDPMNSPIMMEHMDWHNLPENKSKTGNYGERFLLFHKQYIEKFDNFRISKSFLPLSPWDPSTPIPPQLAHEEILVAPRLTDNPYSVNYLCKTPTWLTVAGGIDVDPKFGYTSLSQFQSLDELGFAIDYSWHATVHNTIGGDMSMFHSPIDPIFWPWHKWIDDIRATWEGSRVSLMAQKNISAVVAILFGVTGNGGGAVITPNGKIIKIPPWDPLLLTDSKTTIDALMGLAINQLSYHLSDSESRQSLQKTAIRLLKNASQQITKQSPKQI